jgi:transposase
LARDNGINDNLLFTWRQRYRHLLPDEIQRSIREQDSVIPVVLPDMVLSHHAEPHYEPAAPACREAMTCEVTVGGASLRLSGDLSPALLKTLIRELSEEPMIPLPSGTRIWLVAGVTDMRKSFNGLGELVQHVLDDNPFSGHLFIFRGRKGDTVRILWADADGLCLFTKRLEEGQFVWPAVRDGKIAITRSQLAMLLDKLDWRKPKTARLNSLTML